MSSQKKEKLLWYRWIINRWFFEKDYLHSLWNREEEKWTSTESSRRSFSGYLHFFLLYFESMVKGYVMWAKYKERIETTLTRLHCCWWCDDDDGNLRCYVRSSQYEFSWSSSFFHVYRLVYLEFFYHQQIKLFNKAQKWHVMHHNNNNNMSMYLPTPLFH